jgi:hypothetical protein
LSRSPLSCLFDNSACEPSYKEAEGNYEAILETKEGKAALCHSIIKGIVECGEKNSFRTSEKLAFRSMTKSGKRRKRPFFFRAWIWRSRWS